MHFECPKSTTPTFFVSSRIRKLNVHFVIVFIISSSSPRQRHGKKVVDENFWSYFSLRKLTLPRSLPWHDETAAAYVLTVPALLPTVSGGKRAHAAKGRRWDHNPSPCTISGVSSGTLDGPYDLLGEAETH